MLCPCVRGAGDAVHTPAHWCETLGAQTPLERVSRDHIARLAASHETVLAPRQPGDARLDHHRTDDGEPLRSRTSRTSRCRPPSAYANCEMLGSTAEMGERTVGVRSCGACTSACWGGRVQR